MIGIAFCLAASVFGSVTVSIPFFKVAVMLSAATGPATAMHCKVFAV